MTTLAGWAGASDTLPSKMTGLPLPQSTEAYSAQYLPPPFIVPSTMAGFPLPFGNTAQSLPPPFKSMGDGNVLGQRCVL